MVEQEFNRVRDLVEHVLENYPETRNSDNKLYLQCLKLKGANTLDDIARVDLNLITVHKTRQKIQNGEGKFQADGKVQQVRSERQIEIKNYMKNSQTKL